MDHFPFPPAKFHPEPFRVAGTKPKKTASGRNARRFTSLDGEFPSGGFRMPHKISCSATSVVTAELHRLFPSIFKPVPDKNVSRSRREKLAILPLKEFDLTELRDPAIIMRTSLLWRADKPGVRTRATRMAPKYIFVTGGVVSSLGKGVAASSIGCLLESRGFKV